LAEPEKKKPVVKKIKKVEKKKEVIETVPEMDEQSAMLAYT
jgi:hypothetical protein